MTNTAYTPMHVNIEIRLKNDGRLFFRDNYHEHLVTVNEHVSLRVFKGNAKSPIQDLLGK